MSARDDILAYVQFLVEHDAIDRELYEHLRAQLRDLQLLEAEVGVYPDIRAFMFEAFCLFFKVQPTLVPEAERPHDALFRGRLLEALIATPTFFAHAARARLDEFPAIHATMRVARALLRLMPWRNGGDGMTPQFAAAFARAFAQALAGAAEDEDMLDRIVTGWGTAPGMLRKLPVEEKFRLMDRLQRTSGIQEIARIAGRAVAIADRKRATKLRRDTTEIVGTTVGGAMEHLLPAELALRTRPGLRRIFRLRAAERTLRTYEFRSRAVLGRGPLIVCIDTSGSMQYGDRERWAKGIALALAAQARRDRRTFAYMHFGSALELRQVIIRRHEPGVEQLIDIATYAFGGGTDFDRPMRAAIALIREEEKLRQADIVFLSDGECALSPSVNAELDAVKREFGCSVYGVLVHEAAGVCADIHRAMRDRHARLLAELRHHALGVADVLPMMGLETFCDVVFPVQELTAEAVGDVFDPIIGDR